MTTNDVTGGTGMSGFQVTPEYVREAATSCDTTAELVKEQLDALKAYVQSLEDVWHGVAHNTFQIYMQEYDLYANMLHQALTGIASGLRGTHVNYEQSEQSALDGIRKLQGELAPARLS
ncbi:MULTISPECIES: WXG100 family type VII secretion target [Streptomycetaceae]|uniref:CFP-10 family protein n=1 Tax=Streptantibioticus cattleyicolor (strain ATCC 35852 / DSM 46488 / JCM 4925 / NBRC 14057 / NRRL 8057) TaxID=1003195 RepID=F8JY94_STREN|nr:MULTISPECIES: WXG100 family type VII secretion target [Streptomycetaceae]AEW94686.1 CFP-10 family protein [Streptantibioticus cattleyicolor NRRL 8057 = DSM 46488]MYS59317.1 WXG100 family type VII secretion target [Streptomyces sp. SID5468]CCB75039.1 putative CFP-10 family protein [Streptantibioticus cattleyicolor NRRL 8057 = DSM 46488]